MRFTRTLVEVKNAQTARHARAGGHPVSKSFYWMPACAGMTATTPLSRSINVKNSAIALCVCLLSMGNARSAEPLVDPTAPYGEPGAPHFNNTRAALAPLQLEAILHGSERRLAIVNGRLVHEGDHIANNLIETITPTSVRYSTQGEQRTLSLAGASLPVAQLSIRPATLTQPLKDNQP